MNRIGLIQLSDLQFGALHRFGNPSQIARGLVSDIAAQGAKHGFIPTYLMLTGDIAETGNGREYDDAFSQIEFIRINLNIDPGAVLIIPGNHDICWDLSKVANQAGNPDLKLINFYKFCSRVNERSIVALDGAYPVIFDARNSLQVILTNSCEHEDHQTHKGFVNIARFLASIKQLEASTESESNCLRICLIHHRLDITDGKPSSAVENYEEVEAIALLNRINLVLTGHVHQSSIAITERDGNRLLKTGAGSAGVCSAQRKDGVQNQYSIFIVDPNLKQIESVFRAYNPNLRTQLGIGGWVIDNTFENNAPFPVPFIRTYSFVSQDNLQDARLVEKLGIVSNPFTFNNAEKISPEILLQLFVSDGARHKEAKRLTGDAIIRGPRGAGKTMFLRFLEIFGEEQFADCLKSTRTAECFPVFVKFNYLHKSDLGKTAASFYEAADRLIYDSTINALDDAAKELRQPSFSNAVSRTKTRLDQLKNTTGTRIFKLGTAIEEYLSTYFKHVLLLIDEVATVFPREFFDNREHGFVLWMNAIRNSGPFYTRIAVYPTDVSDVLNEERFGSIINLSYDVRNQQEFSLFYQYCNELVNKYLKQVSKDPICPTDIYNILERATRPEADPLEQLIYASDGSTRRFLALMDKCLNSCSSETRPGRAIPLSKTVVLDVIRSYAQNLVSGYSDAERQMASNIAKVCRKQSTFRFKAPGLSLYLQPLFAAREEFNIVKLYDAGAGRRGSIYEFTYPFCILNDIQTHCLRDSKRIDHNRSYITGEWFGTSARVEPADLYADGSRRATGTVREKVDDLCVIILEPGGQEMWAETPENLEVGDRVSFMFTGSNASDLVKL
jgi:hypothetical protein